MATSTPTRALPAKPNAWPSAIAAASSTDGPAWAWWQPWQQLATDTLSHWQHLGEQLQSQQQHTLQRLQADAQLEAEEAHTMSQPQDLLVLQATLTTEAACRLIELGEQSSAAWLELQSLWWRDLEALLAKALSLWQTNALAQGAGSAGALLCAPEHPTTATLLDTATKAWPVATQVVLNALTHDLQGATTTATTDTRH